MRRAPIHASVLIGSALVLAGGMAMILVVVFWFIGRVMAIADAV